MTPPPKGTKVYLHERFVGGRIGGRIHEDYDLTFERVEHVTDLTILWRLKEASGPRQKTFSGYLLAHPEAVEILLGED